VNVGAPHFFIAPANMYISCVVYLSFAPVKPAQKNTHLQRFPGKNSLTRRDQQFGTDTSVNSFSAHSRGQSTGTKV
jgi:hypothetical protein